MNTSKEIPEESAMEGKCPLMNNIFPLS